MYHNFGFTEKAFPPLTPYCFNCRKKKTTKQTVSNTCQAPWLNAFSFQFTMDSFDNIVFSVRAVHYGAQTFKRFLFVYLFIYFFI